MVSHGDLTIGALTSFLVYTLIVAFALGSLADLWTEFMRATGAADRVFELLDRVPAMPAGGGLRAGAGRGAGRPGERALRLPHPPRGRGAAQPAADPGPRRGGGGGGPLGRGQVDHRRPHPALLRPAGRARAVRRPRRAHARCRLAAAAGGHGGAGAGALLHLHRREHPLRPPRRHPRRGGGRRRRGQRPPLHPVAAGRLRHAGGRAGGAALGRPEAAGGHRPRRAQGPAPAGARRGHQRARRRERAPGQGGARAAHARPHHADHRPPPLDRGRRRPRRGHRRRARSCRTAPTTA